MAAYVSEAFTSLVRRVAEDEGLVDIKIEVFPGSSDGDNYLCQIFKVRVTGREANGGREGCLNLVLKKNPDDPEVKKKIPLEIMSRREFWAYERVLPTLHALQDEGLPPSEKFNCVKFYRGSDQMLVMEDLSVKDFRLYDKLVSLDGDHLDCVLINLARYHATSFALRHRCPETYSELVGGISQRHEYWYNLDVYLEKLRRPVVELYKDAEMRYKIERYFDNALENFSYYLDSYKNEPYNVICHGDYWTNNIVFLYEDDDIIDTRILDWQIIRHASPITDIAYLIFTATDKETRFKHYRRVLDLYYHTFSESLSSMGGQPESQFPREVFEEQIKSYMPYGLVIAIMILPLTLCDEDNPVDISGIVTRTEDGGCEIKFSPNTKRRLRDVIDDFVLYGMI